MKKKTLLVYLFIMSTFAICLAALPMHEKVKILVRMQEYEPAVGVRCLSRSVTQQHVGVHKTQPVMVYRY